MRILVVDDDKIVLDSCTRVLASEGYEVYTAISAGDALNTLEVSTFDLLLIDVKMPEEDGISLMHQVQQQWPDIPMILMSGYSTTATMEEGVQMGAGVFLSKPFTPDELSESVTRALAGRKDRGETEHTDGE
jgi:DNA-binding NtrC family response regulator